MMEPVANNASSNSKKSDNEERQSFISLFIITILLTAVVYFFPTVPKSVGNFYTNLTNPVSWLCGLSGTTEKNAPTTSLMSFLGAFYIQVAEETYPEEIFNGGLRNNLLTEILTLGNDDSLQHLMFAQANGQYNFPYAVFSYDKLGHAQYLAKYTDAPSILLYGYSWFVNLPTKILAQLKVVTFDDDISYNADYTLFLDIILNIASLIIELPIALMNTIVGFFFALVFHPFDSLCSILGSIYFFVYTTASAVWDFILVFFN